MGSLFDVEEFSWIFRRIPEYQALQQSHPNLVFRSIQLDDYDKGFLEVLKQMTVVGEVSKESFANRFHAMCSLPNTYFILVTEDTTTARVVACSSLVIEMKFIHGCALRGRIEDLVVDKSYRRRGCGTIMLKFMIQLSRTLGCYKVNLESEPERMVLYRRLSFVEVPNQTYMEIRFRE